MGKVRVNSYQGNYMARRAELYGIIRSNPNWCTLWLAKEETQENPLGYEKTGRVFHCSLGHVLSVLGYTDEQLMHMREREAVRIISNMFRLKRKTVERICQINDYSGSFDQVVRGMRAYLLNKNYKRAEKIINMNRLAF